MNLKRLQSYQNYIIIIIISLFGLFITSALQLVNRIDKSSELQIHVISILISVIYYVMIILWSISNRRRISQNNIKKYLNAIARLMVAWLFVHVLKENYIVTPSSSRWLLYIYYIPLIFIPMFGYFATCYIRKPDNYRIRFSLYWLYSIATILVVMILTNDYHGLIFKMDSLEEYNQSYGYNIGYYAIVSWVGVLEILSVQKLHVALKTEKLGIKKYMPYVFVILSGLCAYLYAMAQYFAEINDKIIIIIFGWLTVMLWETCAFLGMIPVNSYYKDIFKNAAIRAQIVDFDGKPYISAANAINISNEVFLDLKKTGKRYYNNRTQLNLYPLSCGYVIWQEDVGELTEMIEEQMQNQKDLQAGNQRTEEEMRVQVRQQRIEEQNRIYTILSEAMKSRIMKIDRLCEEVLHIEDETEARKKLEYINIVGVVLKRRSNFIMISESQGSIPPEELMLCMMELSKNLSICGMKLNYDVLISRDMECEELLWVFDKALEFVEEQLFKNDDLRLVFKETGDKICAEIYVDGEAAGYICSEEGGNV